MQQNFRRNKAKLFIISGADNSGKDEIVSAVRYLAKNKANVVKKYTTRNQKLDDEDELICKYIIKDKQANENELKHVLNEAFDLSACDVSYKRKGNTYGINTKDIWEGFQRGMFQFISVSDEETINKLIKIFGDLCVLVFCYSIERSSDFELAFNTYVNNIDKYDHVFIFEEKQEDLYDQCFRLMNYYEK